MGSVLERFLWRVVLPLLFVAMVASRGRHFSLPDALPSLIISALIVGVFVWQERKAARNPDFADTYVPRQKRANRWRRAILIYMVVTGALGYGALRLMQGFHPDRDTTFLMGFSAMIFIWVGVIVVSVVARR